MEDSLSLLIEAVIEDNPDQVIALLNTGADPNQVEDDACITLLHYAAQNNALLVIPVLIEAGADIFAETNPEGYTPLDVALIHGHDRVVQALLAYENETDIRQQ